MSEARMWPECPECCGESLRVINAVYCKCEDCGTEILRTEVGV